MKTLNRLPIALVVFCSMVVFGATAVMGQSVLYSTSFEAPVFSVGPIDGQDDWTGDGAIQNATSYIRSGTQSLSVDGDSRVSRYFIDAATLPVFIDGYFREPAVDTVPDATSLQAGTSFVLFHKTQGILAFDGDGDSGGTWVATGIQVATTTFQRVTIAQDYDEKVWLLYINEQPVGYNGQTPYHFGFRDDTIESFCGIDIDSATGSSSYVDDFTISYNWPDFLLKNSPPDILVYSFLREWYFNQSDAGSNAGLTWDLVPGATDTNKVDAFDLLDLLQNISPQKTLKKNTNN